ncbi:MAG: glycosyl transferase [Cryomorphaceae bacterium]|nr:MAG: glycosyl transferase [Cryomorphaceae bacterium]
MKILYAIQGTGNGHITRAEVLVDVFKALPNTTVDVLVSGTEYNLNLPFSVKYHLSGLSFVFGNKGGIDYRCTLGRLRFGRLVRDIRKLPVWEYDLVVSDFEPVSAWAAKIRKVPCVGLSNQAHLLTEPGTGKKPGWLNQLILKHYAPSGNAVSFHYIPNDRFAFPPIIRSRVRNAPVGRGEHFLVYLPSYSDLQIIRTLRQVRGLKWVVYSKRATRTEYYGHITIRPLQESGFVADMATCRGMLCNAGFGTTSEALHIGKKMLVIPMKKQYEQQYNATFLESIGVHTLSELHPQFANDITHWARHAKPIKLTYDDQRDVVVQAVLTRYTQLIPDDTKAYAFTNKMIQTIAARDGVIAE